MEEKAVVETEIVQPKVTIGYNVSSQDVVNVVISKKEQDIKAKISQLQVEDAKLQKARTELESQLSAQVKTEANAHYEAEVEKISKPLKKIFPQLKTEIKGSYSAKRGLNGEETTYLGVAFSIFHQAHGSPDFVSITRRAELPISEEIKKIESELVTNRDQQTENQNQRFALRKELSNLDSLERQARAILSQKALMTSAEGRSMLKALEDGIESLPKLLEG